MATKSVFNFSTEFDEAAKKKQSSLLSKKLSTSFDNVDAMSPETDVATAGASNLDKGAALAKVGQATGLVPKGGMMGGAVSGAATGAAFGPYGAVIGGVAGAVMGAAQSRAAARAHNAKLEKGKYEALGAIEENKGKQIQNAMATMAQRMSLR